MIMIRFQNGFKKAVAFLCGKKTAGNYSAAVGLKI